MEDRPQLTAETLGYWFLRLNGFLTIPNFVVHPDVGVNQATEVDAIGVRFPFRREPLDASWPDHPKVEGLDDGLNPLLVLVEIKAARCKLNGPWLNASRRNMQRVLTAVGIIPEGTELESVASDLYANGVSSSTRCRVSMLCIGSEYSQGVPEQVPQILWRKDVLPFIYQRYKRDPERKARHDQWPAIGDYLWDASERMTEADFVEAFAVVERVRGSNT
jgi:hypothetical protein